MAINPDYDKTFDCLVREDYASLIKLYTSVTGYAIGGDYVVPDYAFTLTTKVRGKGVVGKIYEFDKPTMSISVRGTGWINVEKANWVAWSQIGAANFEVNRTNDAGYRPMSWPGYVYQIIPLDKNAIVYGSNGVTMMYPVAQPMATFGFKDLMYQGLKCKTAVAGSDVIHFFITKEGNLWSLTSEGPKKLGYKEFLQPMKSPILLWDAQKQALYISDETTGYVYTSNAMGGWFTGVTGITRVGDTLYVVSPNLVLAPRMELVTDTLDMGIRGRKDIENVEVAVDSSGPVYVSLDYRYDKTHSFRSLPYRRVSPEGFVRIPLSATELRLRIRNEGYNTIKLYYINLQVKISDKRFIRGVRGEQI